MCVLRGGVPTTSCPVFLTLLNERHMMQENIRQFKCETWFYHRSAVIQAAVKSDIFSGTSLIDGQ